MDNPPSNEVRRPDSALRQLAALLPFDRPRALLARLDGPYDDQRVPAATELWRDPPRDEQRRTSVTTRALRRLKIPDWSREPYATWPLVLPVVVRPGTSWWSWDEGDVMLGLRYGSNLLSVRQAGPLTVTTRGWYDQFDHLWGVTPRAVFPVPA